MDSIDCKILRELQSDARLSHQELSERVGLSPSPCARRIRRLEDDGIITGYSAQFDEVKLGFAFNVFISVRLDRQIDDRLVAVENEVRHRFARIPGVAQVDLWGGYNREVRVELDPERIKSLGLPLDRVISAIRDGVQTVLPV